MAKLRPELQDDDLRKLQSSAEAAFYRACRDQLPDGVLVVHSAAWTYRTSDGTPSEGEADFTIFDPKGGFVTVEVKGGGIEYDGTLGKWSSTDRYGNKREIKDPFRQATREKHCVLDQLKGSQEWRQTMGSDRILAGHAVFFPDIDDIKKLVGPNAPAELIGGRQNLKDLTAWLATVASFWTGKSNFTLIQDRGVRIAERIFCSSISVKALLAADIEREEQIRIELTTLQAKILRTIGGRKRAVISGGAGTGKTLIAVEKARQLASQGLSVLLLCYNHQLFLHLARVLEKDPKIRVFDFHKLVSHRVALAEKKTGRNLMKEASEAYPDHSLYDVQMPFALALANELVEEKYDAVVVDEAQDFSDEYWFAIEEVLNNTENSYFYVFTDPNQSVYRRHANVPIKEEPFFLLSNCRNTAPIHEAAYLFYQGEPVEAPPISGELIQYVIAEDIDVQARAIVDVLNRLILQERVSPDDICVLLARPDGIPGPGNKVYWAALERQISKQKAFRTTQSIDPRPAGTVLMDTVNRFKGLETLVAVLWLAEGLDEERHKEVFYVGLSRPKSRSYIVGREIPRRLINDKRVTKYA